MATRNTNYTLKLEEREVSVLDYFVASAGTRDKSSVIRALIWDAGLKFGILTSGDVADLATLEKQARHKNRK